MITTFKVGQNQNLEWRVLVDPWWRHLLVLLPVKCFSNLARTDVNIWRLFQCPAKRKKHECQTQDHLLKYTECLCTSDVSNCGRFVYVWHVLAVSSPQQRFMHNQLPGSPRQGHQRQLRHRWGSHGKQLTLYVQSVSVQRKERNFTLVSTIFYWFSRWINQIEQLLNTSYILRLAQAEAWICLFNSTFFSLL